MGSMVSLGIDQFEIDLGKNGISLNHSQLFQPQDRKMIPYYYCDDQSEGIVAVKKVGYGRPLRDVVRRLELLGYSLTNVAAMYESTRQAVDTDNNLAALDFPLFLKIMTAADIRRIDAAWTFPAWALDDDSDRNILQHPEFNKVFELRRMSRWDISEFFESLDPYVILRALLENPRNAKLELQWRTADVIENGWASEEEAHPRLEDSDKFLIVTEGSSDSAVIRHALNILSPGIADFFTFIDMEENYPFTGVGNLFRFCQGLSRIRIQNKVLVVFDNDAAGVEKFRAASKLDLPSNMRVLKLPDLPQFSKFPTLGPSGQRKLNINGQAVATECFLDLAYKANQAPMVRWTAYNDTLEVYQGALAGKERYTKAFLKLRGRTKGYNFAKLERLLAWIYEQCVCLTEAADSG